MDKDQYEDDDAKYIASKIILSKLDILPVNLEITINHKNSSEKVLKQIEILEDKWELNTADDFPYGRHTKNEPIRFWSIPLKSAKVIAYLLLYTNSKNVLEVGTSVGYSTIHLASAAEHTKGHIHTIENFSVKNNLANKNFKDSKLDNRITLIQGHASDILENWKAPIDFVFLDADKENYGKYLDLILPHLEPRSLIVADNLNDYGHMMTDFLQKVSGSHFPGSRTYPSLKSTYVAQLDNGLIVTKFKREENEKK